MKIEYIKDSDNVICGILYFNIVEIESDGKRLILRDCFNSKELIPTQSIIKLSINHNDLCVSVFRNIITSANI